MVRGVVHQFELFKMFMQTQMFPLKRYSLDTCECGQKIDKHDDKACPHRKFKRKLIETLIVQGGLRDIGFMYEYVFPEEYLAEVLSMLEISPHNNRWNIGGFKSWVIRKALGKGDSGDGVKPIPEYKPVIHNRYIERRGVAIYPIGIKKDRYGEMLGLYQELL